MVRPMSEADDLPQPATPREDVPFDDFEVETEALPDGRQIHYYRWPTDEPPTADV